MTSQGSPRGALGVVSGPSWGRLGAVFRPSWAILGRLGAVLEPSWAILDPSWGRLGAAFGLLGQLGTQDRPKRAQDSPKTIWTPFWCHFGVHFGSPNWFKIHFVGKRFFGLCLKHFWGNFGEHFGTRSSQKGPKTSPRRTLRVSNTQKAAFTKTLKNLKFF